jgi:hypothetical protein
LIGIIVSFSLGLETRPVENSLGEMCYNKTDDQSVTQNMFVDRKLVDGGGGKFFRF